MGIHLLNMDSVFLLAREILRPIKNSIRCKDGKPTKQSHSLYVSQQNE